MVTQSSKPFTEVQFIKDCLIKVSKIICPDKVKLYEALSLSANVVASRITDSVKKIHHQPITAAQGLVAFSLAMDENAGVTDTAYCAVFIRGIVANLNVTKELLGQISIRKIILDCAIISIVML